MRNYLSSFMDNLEDEKIRRDSILFICTTLKKIKNVLLKNNVPLSEVEMISLNQIDWLITESTMDTGTSYLECSLCENLEDFNFWAFPHSKAVSSKNLNLLDIEETTHQTLAQISSNKFFKKELSHDKFVLHISDLIKENVLKFENWEINILHFLGNVSTSIKKDSICSTALTHWCVEMASRSESSIFLEAWRALWNVKGTKPIYLDGIYPLVPPWETEKPALDIVLVHGIKGGASYTWRQLDSEKTKSHVIHQEYLKENTRNGAKLNINDKYSWIWPFDWMVGDLKLNARIIALNYPSDWLEKGKFGNETKDMETISREFLPKLKLAGVGSRPIVWIGHSMGGIIVKKMLDYSEVSKQNGAPSSLVDSTVGVVFMAVPHFGSFFASCSCFFGALLRPSLLLRQMRTDNPQLKALNDSFVSICQQNSIKVLTLSESRPSKISPLGPKLLMVPHSQADSGIGEFCKVDASHLDICKPKNRSSTVYLAIKNFIDDICESIIG